MYQCIKGKNCIIQTDLLVGPDTNYFLTNHQREYRTIMLT